jgi:hypothetical protein
VSARGVEEVDALVVGANLRGLVSAHVLGRLGLRTVLVERGRALGGADASFETPAGTRFELGMHVLDYLRSPQTTRLFTEAVGGEVYRTKLRRGLLLRNQVMPYAPAPAEMPPELARLLPPGELVDDIGGATPTRAALARCYGRGYADFVLDEVLPSFPSENRHRALGVDEALLLDNIYPWFFPRARRAAKPGDESREFHDRLRDGVPQEILYPKRGGFGGFARGLAERFDPRVVEVLTGAEDFALEIAPATHTATGARALGRRFRARHYFWAAAWPALCKLLGLPCQDPASDRVLVGSFRLSEPAQCAYDELLIGDPRLRINRLYFPARFRESDEPLLQVEFAVPLAESWPADAAHWREAWLADLARAGILQAQHRVEEFDFRSAVMHFNAYGMEGERLRDADPALLRADSNIHPVVPSMANLNLNRYVPRAIEYVSGVAARA